MKILLSSFLVLMMVFEIGNAESLDKNRMHLTILGSLEKTFTKLINNRMIDVQNRCPNHSAKLFPSHCSEFETLYDNCTVIIKQYLDDIAEACPGIDDPCTEHILNNSLGGFNDTFTSKCSLQAFETEFLASRKCYLELPEFESTTDDILSEKYVTTTDEAIGSSKIGYSFRNDEMSFCVHQENDSTVLIYFDKLSDIQTLEEEYSEDFEVQR